MAFRPRYALPSQRPLLGLTGTETCIWSTSSSQTMSALGITSQVLLTPWLHVHVLAAINLPSPFLLSLSSSPSPSLPLPFFPLLSLSFPFTRLPSTPPPPSLLSLLSTSLHSFPSLPYLLPSSSLSTLPLLPIPPPLSPSLLLSSCPCSTKHPLGTSGRLLPALCPTERVRTEQVPKVAHATPLLLPRPTARHLRGQRCQVRLTQWSHSHTLTGNQDLEPCTANITCSSCSTS